MAGTSAADAKPLIKISDAFKELEAIVKSQGSDVDVASFSRASSLVSPLFGCLGIAFKFAELDYVSKVHDLADASKSIETLTSLIDRDVQTNTVRKAGSHTRNLLRVKRGLDMVRVLFEEILITDVVSDSCHGEWSGSFGASPKAAIGRHTPLTTLLSAAPLAYPEALPFTGKGGNSLRNPASKAYAQVFAPHHAWAIRKAVAAGMYALPTKQQLLNKLNEDESSARVQMQNYVTASAPLIQYIEKLFMSRELGIDW